MAKLWSKTTPKPAKRLKQIATENGIDLPEQIGEKSQAALSKLEKTSGEELDRTFLHRQEKAHRADIARFERIGEQSENNAIRQFATETLPALRKHLEMVQEASERDRASSEGASR